MVWAHPPLAWGSRWNPRGHDTTVPARTEPATRRTWPSPPFGFTSLAHPQRRVGICSRSDRERGDRAVGMRPKTTQVGSPPRSGGRAGDVNQGGHGRRRSNDHDLATVEPATSEAHPSQAEPEGNPPNAAGSIEEEVPRASDRGDAPGSGSTGPVSTPPTEPDESGSQGGRTLSDLTGPQQPTPNLPHGSIVPTRIPARPPHRGGCAQPRSLSIPATTPRTGRHASSEAESATRRAPARTRSG